MKHILQVIGTAASAAALGVEYSFSVGLVAWWALLLLMAIEDNTEKR